MIPSLRRSYNAAFSQEKFRGYHTRLEEEAGCSIPFRLAESPVFLPPDLLDEMVSASLEIWRQLSTPENLKRSEAAVPDRFDVPGCDAHPLFAVTDFAVTRAPGGRLAPRLIELQAFPSLYAFQLFQTIALRDLCPEPVRLDFLLSGLDPEGYRRAVGDAILGGLPPENVVLLDLDPPSQKTFVDFALTEKLWDVRAVCPTKVEKRGRELWYDRDGKTTRILRIYNRLIFDELAHKGVELPIDFRETLDVAWAGHPNWYFRWSKHALPVLRHPTVPEAHFLSDLATPPEDLSNWVLKPLFSFAGSGVKVDVTPSDIAAVPSEERPHTLLMRKVEYAPIIETTDGSFSKVEIRIMFIWKNGEPFPVTTLARLSQGKMMGVAFNKDHTWVGSSGCLWPSLRLRSRGARLLPRLLRETSRATTGVGTLPPPRKTARSISANIYCMRRTTVYLEPETDVLLKGEAVRRKKPVAELIREALDTYVRRTGARLPPGIGDFHSGHRDTANRAEELLEQTGFGEEGREKQKTTRKRPKKARPAR